MSNQNQIQQLRDEAAAAGDREQVQLCDLALLGDQDSIDECRRVIHAAQAVDDAWPMVEGGMTDA